MNKYQIVKRTETTTGYDVILGERGTYSNKREGMKAIETILNSVHLTSLNSGYKGPVSKSKPLKKAPKSRDLTHC